MADLLEENADAIMEANGFDIAAAKGQDMAPTLLARLVLSPKKLGTLAAGLRQIASASDPIGNVLRKTELADGLVLTQKTVPIGVLLIIFESRPDALPQIAALAVRSGNGLLLKGGKEALCTNTFLHRLVAQAIEEGSNSQVDGSLVGFITTRDEISDLLKLDHVIDLVIPRGSGALVKHIQQNTKIPVMGHAEGICHVYVDSTASLSKAIKLILDAKIDYPAACNACETLLIHSSWFAGGQQGGKQIIKALHDANVTTLGGPRASKELQLFKAKSLREEYGDLSITVELVDSMQEAIDHIHLYGSGHTEAIVTEDSAVGQQFLNQVDAACVFLNTSTRFADGYRFGLGAEVGISTGRIHARGPVGVEGLTTTKWIISPLVVSGEGSDAFTAGEFSAGEKKFTHLTLPVSDSSPSPSTSLSTATASGVLEAPSLVLLTKALVGIGAAALCVAGVARFRFTKA